MRFSIADDDRPLLGPLPTGDDAVGFDIIGRRDFICGFDSCTAPKSGWGWIDEEYESLIERVCFPGKSGLSLSLDCSSATRYQSSVGDPGEFPCFAALFRR